MQLFVVEGPDAGRSFALSADSVIGRDPTAAVHLSDEEVSRRHAIISLGEGNATIEDLGSVNGTHVGETAVNGEMSVKSGDRIRVGQTVLELRQLPGMDPDNLPPTKTSLPLPNLE